MYIRDVLIFAIFANRLHREVINPQKVSSFTQRHVRMPLVANYITTKYIGEWGLEITRSEYKAICSIIAHIHTSVL